ncbi:MAG: alkaline phosphatase family protein [Candidatus Krumholzibacteria bacterium]|nr:alkaline phosphatase family protein [Candidatus Krumholzibacteria bacterium]
MSKKVLIIIDALGFELVSRHAFRPEGLSDAVRLETVPGFSQSALTSIMTGINPDEHELWMMYSFADDDGPFRFIRSVPGMSDTSRLWVRRLVNWKLRRLDGVSAYYNLYDVPGTVLPYLDLPARKRLFAPESVRGRSTILDRAIESGINVKVWDYETPEDKAFDELNVALKEEGNGFYLLYTAGLDAVMHMTGTGSTETKEKLEWYRKRIEGLLCKQNGLMLAVMGDHGMCDVTAHIDLVPEIEDAGFRIPDDYIPFFDSTMARFRINDLHAGDKIREILCRSDRGRILKEDELVMMGIKFSDGRFGDIIFQLDAGNIIVPSYMGKTPVAAMHGYHPAEESMFSALFTNRDVAFSGSKITDVAPFFIKTFSGQVG